MLYSPLLFDPIRIERQNKHKNRNCFGVFFVSFTNLKTIFVELIWSQNF